MGFGDILGRPSTEERTARESEKRQMIFRQGLSREEAALQASYADDQTYLGTQEAKSDLLRWQQDFESDLLDMRYRFLGWKKKGDVWTEPAQITKKVLGGDGKEKEISIKPKRLCNELFIDQVLDPTCRFFLSRQFCNSNLSELRITSMLRRNFNNLAKTLIIKHKKYGIKFEDFDDIDRQLKIFLISAAFRALQGWTKKIDSTMIKRVEALHEGPALQDMPRKKFLGLIG